MSSKHGVCVIVPKSIFVRIGAVEYYFHYNLIIAVVVAAKRKLHSLIDSQEAQFLDDVFIIK